MVVETLIQIALPDPVEEPHPVLPLNILEVVVGHNLKRVEEASVQLKEDFVLVGL